MSTPEQGLAASLRAAGFRGNLEVEAPLAPATTWRLGGPAELLAHAADREDVFCALAWAASRHVPWRLLGNGSNLLIREAGVRGLVLRVRRALDGFRRDGETIEAGGGASLPALAHFAAGAGLAGLEFAAGIPGTVGGAIVMNAGWHAHEIGNVVEQVEFLDAAGDRRILTRDECDFGYRHSALRAEPGVVLSARLRLRPDDPEVLRARLEDYAATRRANQPIDQPSCGSVYLKPEGDFAGRLIEQAGLKGLRVGGIEVSVKHANFFVNLGTGTAADAIRLMETIEREVEARFGVRLRREVEVW